MKWVTHKPARYLAVLSSIVSAFSASAAFSQSSNAEKWPTRPIRLIIPFTAGGSLDVVARTLGQKLGEALDTTVVIDNRAGANGIIGTDAVAKAAPDGYTMLMTTGSFTANTTLYKQLPHDAIKDFAPITQVARSYGLILAVNNDVPARSVKELIELAKAKPNKLSFGSGGQGNLTHLAGALFNHLAHTEILHVPYKGSGPAFNDVIAKQIDMTFVSTAGSATVIKEGRVRPLAISSAQRAPIVPDVPTFDEAGLKGMDQVYGWYGLWFPAGTPKERVDRVQQAVAKLLPQPEVKASFDQLGLITVGSTPSEFARFIVEDTAFQAKLLKLANIQPQ